MPAPGLTPAEALRYLGDESQHPHLAGLVAGPQAPQEFILGRAAVGDLLVFQVPQWRGKRSTWPPARQTGCCTKGSQVAPSGSPGCSSAPAGGLPWPSSRWPTPSARSGFLPPTLRPSRPWAVGPAQQPQGGVCEEVGGDACRVFVHRKATSFVPLVTMTRIPVGCVVNRGAISSGPLL